MADITIDFTSNAPAVTREVTQAEHATLAAAKATTALDKAVASIEKRLGSEARALKGAAAAAAEYSKALRSSQNALTGAPGRSRGAGPNQDLLDSSKAAARRTNIQRALANENRAIREQMEKDADKHGGSFGAGIRRSMERALNRGGFFGAKDSPIAKMLGGKDSNGNATAAGAGVAATIAIGAAYYALSKAVEVANAALDGHKDKLSRVAQGQLENIRLMREARDLNRAAGVAAEQQHGGSILEVTANGGQAALDTVRAKARAAGTDENDAASAYSTLYSRFAGNQAEIAQGLAIGADVSKVTGKSLNETVSTLGRQELGDKDKARDRITALSLGHITVNGGEYRTAAANQAGSADAGRVKDIRGSLANADVNADNNLEAGKVGAMDVAARAGNPGAAMISDHLRALQEQATVLHSIDDNTKGLWRALDRLLNPASTARRAAMAADDQVNLVGGSGAVQ